MYQSVSCFRIIQYHLEQKKDLLVHETRYSYIFDIDVFMAEYVSVFRNLTTTLWTMILRKCQALRGFLKLCFNYTLCFRVQVLNLIQAWFILLVFVIFMWSCLWLLFCVIWSVIRSRFCRTLFFQKWNKIKARFHRKIEVMLMIVLVYI